MEVHNDSICISMALDANRLAMLVALTLLTFFLTSISSTATGKVRVLHLQLKVRVLSRGMASILVPWILIHCSVLQNRYTIIFRGKL